MIRALALALCVATSVTADTPVDVSIANDLRLCVRDDQGTRDPARLALLDASMAQLPNRRWGSVTEVATRVFHVTDTNRQITIEIKLPDANGTAHCLAFGPKLSAGQAALVADKFAEFQFLAGLAQASPAQGMTRRYLVDGAPYSAELVALQTSAQGDVVGFMFSGVPQDLATRALSSNDQTVTYRSVSTALGNAVNTCLRNFGNSDTVEAALSAWGFELGFADGRDRTTRTYFTPDNTVSIRISPGYCQIDTNYMRPAATVQIIGERLNIDAPGMFISRTERHSGCVGFYAGPNLNLPLSLNIYNIGGGGPATCTDAENSRITFVVAG